MISITVFRDSQNQISGIECRGHADFDEYGKDIVCAAVSALTLNFANSVEKFTDDSFSGQMDEETGEFVFHFDDGKISRESRLLMDSLVLGLTNIQESFGKNILISDVRRWK